MEPPFLSTQIYQSSSSIWMNWADKKKFGSISVSGQLPTYPSPNPTLTLSCYQLTVVELGEGLVGSCPDTDIDPKI